MQNSWIDQNEIDELLGSFKGAGSKRGLRPKQVSAKAAGSWENGSPASGAPEVISSEVKSQNFVPEPMATDARGFFDDAVSVAEPAASPERSLFWEDDLNPCSLEVTTSPSERDAAKAAQALGEARRRADESKLLKAPPAAPLADPGPPPILDPVPPALDKSIPPLLPDILPMGAPPMPEEKSHPVTSVDPEIAMSRRITLLLEQVRSELSPRFIAIIDDKGFLLHGDDVMARGHTPEPRDVFQTQRFFGDHAEEVVQVCDGAGWWYIRIPAIWPHGQVSWQLEAKEPVEMSSARRYAKLLADTMFPVNSIRAGEEAASFE